jgi:hypothetical protein
MLFAVPNGEKRDAVTAAILRGQGVRPGVSDLVLVLPEGRSAYVEVKTEADRIRNIRRTEPGPDQLAFQARIEALGHLYRVVRSTGDYADLLVELGVPIRARPMGPAALGTLTPPAARR